MIPLLQSDILQHLNMKCSTYTPHMQNAIANLKSLRVLFLEVTNDIGVKLHLESKSLQQITVTSYYGSFGCVKLEHLHIENKQVRHLRLRAPQVKSVTGKGIGIFDQVCYPNLEKLRAYFGETVDLVLFSKQHAKLKSLELLYNGTFCTNEMASTLRGLTCFNCHCLHAFLQLTTLKLIDGNRDTINSLSLVCQLKHLHLKGIFESRLPLLNIESLFLKRCEFVDCSQVQTNSISAIKCNQITGKTKTLTIDDSTCIMMECETLHVEGIDSRQCERISLQKTHTVSFRDPSFFLLPKMSHSVLHTICVSSLYGLADQLDLYPNIKNVRLKLNNNLDQILLQKDALQSSSYFDILDRSFSFCCSSRECCFFGSSEDYSYMFFLIFVFENCLN